MRLTKRFMVAGAVLLVSAGAAMAATSPSGTFKGAVHWSNSSDHNAKSTFDITTTFHHGKLTGLSGMGNPGFIPFSHKKSTSTFCGAANDYSDTGTKITEKAAPKGFQWEFVISPKQPTGYGWFTVTLKGNWASSTKASTEIRFYEHHMPDKGVCDSGYLPLTLKKS